MAVDLDEALMNQLEPLTDFDLVEVRGDRLAMVVQRPWPLAGLNQKLVRLLLQTATGFPSNR